MLRNKRSNPNGIDTYTVGGLDSATLFGYEQHLRAKYRGRRWVEVEPELREQWELRFPDTSWGRARKRVRQAWEQSGE